MSRNHRARLERLERISEPTSRQHDSGPVIIPDPAFAAAFRSESNRYVALLRKKYGPSENGGPLSEAETEELKRLEERANSRSEALKEPGPDIERRMNELHTKEEKQACSPAEQDELDCLRAAYRSPQSDLAIKWEGLLNTWRRGSATARTPGCVRPLPFPVRQ